MKDKRQKKIPELLVPAGGPEQLKAAVANGADAVYLSGSSFNARINADNFTDETIEAAIGFAHRYGVRVHVALNTLIRQREMEEAVRFAERCRNLGADALIIQDRGLGSELMKRIPDMELHLSTQGTVYDRRGAEEAFQSGFRRVILSRELSLKEIERICRNSSGEIEIFVHGAICIAYSGQCRLSFAIGGRSGNRGTCAQPCRLPYELERNGEPLPAAGGNFLLSPADMCLADSLSGLIDAGVDSLKIEGRMKSPQYVAAVTSVYRRYLDYAAEGRPRTMADEDRKTLLSVFNRGGMTDAYLRGDSGSSLMSCAVPKHQGIYIGQVRAYDSARGHVSAVLNEPLSVGDGIEIRDGKSLCGNIVTYLNDRGTMLKAAPAGSRVTIGDLHGKIRPGAAIYRITDRTLMKKLEESYRNVPGRIPVNMILTAGEGKAVQLELSAPLFRRTGSGLPQIASVHLQSEETSERAVKRIPQVDTVRKQLAKTGGTPYVLKECRVEISGSPMIPSSLLNALRRNGLEKLTTERLRRMEERKNTEKSDPEKTERQNENYTENRVSCDFSHHSFAWQNAGRQPDRCVALHFYETEENSRKIFDILKERRLTSEIEKNVRLDIYLPYRFLLPDPKKFYEMASSDGFVRLIPYLPPVTKGFDERRLQTDADRLYELFCEGYIDGVSVSSRGQILLFEKGKIPLIAGENLHLYNSASVKEIQSLGICRGVLSDELPDEDVKEILKGKTPEKETFLPELSIYGRISVMYTEHCVIGSSDGKEPCSETDKKYYCREGKYVLKDRKNASFPLLTDCSTCRMEILSHKPIDRFRLFDEIDKTAKKKSTFSNVIPRINIFSESPSRVISLAGRAELILLSRSFAADEKYKK